MKIYTKQGDAGMTSLFGGVRTSKNNPRIEAYGTIDELNSVLGIVISLNPTEFGKNILNQVQQMLFVVGADLATPEDKKERISRTGKQEITKLELWIDEMQERLPDLKHFILPGGSPVGAHLHLARTVCRRAERMIIGCRQNEPVSDNLVILINRLSDLLFVMARYENYQSGETETPWIPDKNKD
ncbi:MAG: cob(I)yrinic acid a,c-diamide adenosyltransferase [Balneolaceae bacterium]